MKNLKLLPNEVKYVINEENKVVTAIITFSIQDITRVCSNLDYESYSKFKKKALSYNGVNMSYKDYSCDVFTVSGVAKCSPEDVFDIEKGKKIAESKATLKAFKFYIYLINLCYKHYNDTLKTLYLNREKWVSKFYKELNHLELLSEIKVFL